MPQNFESAVAHLTPEQLNQLIAEYYAGKKINDLLSKYGVKCSGGNLYKAFPPEVCADSLCPYCDVPMHLDRSSRSALACSWRREDRHCPACGHRDNPDCSCRNCRAVIEMDRRKAVDTQRKLINAFCQSIQLTPRVRVSVAEMSLFEAVALLTLARACTILDKPDSNGNVVLGPLENATPPMAPGNEFAVDLVDQLMGFKLISIADSSSVGAFEYEEGKLAGYFNFRVNWALTVEEPLLLLEEIEKLAANPEKWPEAWHQDTSQLWRDIALEECKEYFACVAEERGFPPAGATSTEAMLKNILNDYSVGQCYRIIYMGAQHAADFLVRKQCTRMHAANYMIGATQRWADRARAEKWEVGHFRRRFNLPRSVLSHVFFDVFLGIGEKGFTEVPPLQPPGQDEPACQKHE